MILFSQVKLEKTKNLAVFIEQELNKKRTTLNKVKLSSKNVNESDIYSLILLKKLIEQNIY